MRASSVSMIACASVAAESVLRSSGRRSYPELRDAPAPEWLVPEKRTRDRRLSGAQSRGGGPGASVMNDGVDAGEQPVMRSAGDEVNSGLTRLGGKRATACGEQSALSVRASASMTMPVNAPASIPGMLPNPTYTAALPIEEGRELGVRPPRVAVEKPIAGHQHVLSQSAGLGTTCDCRRISSGRLTLTSGTVQAERRAAPVADHPAEQQTRAVNRQAVADAIERSQRRERQHRTRERRRRREAG